MKIKTRSYIREISNYVYGKRQKRPLDHVYILHLPLAVFSL